MPSKRHATEDGGLLQFSLRGGPFHDFVAKRLPRFGGDGAPALGAGLSVVLWLVLAVLATVEGYADKFFSLQALAIHARMLVAVPLIFMCQAFFDGAVQTALAALVSNEVITGDAKAALDKDAQRLGRLNTSWSLQVGLLFAVVIFSFATPIDYRPGLSGYVGNASAATGSITLAWYGFVCLPIFRFVMVRFLWLLAMWSYLVWRMSRSRLELAAEDPDRAGGLGLLEFAQEKLFVFVLAIAVIDAAALAETFQSIPVSEPLIYTHIFLITLMGLLVVCGPLIFLVSPLYACRQQGLIEFGALARAYSVGFRKRWLLSERPGDEELLGSSDIQSLADLGAGYGRVRAMRILPAPNQLLVIVFGCAAVPHLPLLLLKYPMTDILTDMMQKFIGF